MGSQCFTLRVGAAAATTHGRLPAGWGGGRKREGHRGNARNCSGQEASRASATTRCTTHATTLLKGVVGASPTATSVGVRLSLVFLCALAR